MVFNVNNIPNDPLWYQSWFDSPYYDMLYAAHNEQEAHLLLDRLTQYLQMPQAAKVLDLACGAGRFTRYLNRLGYQTAGLDLSAYQIEKAKGLSDPFLHFYQHDARIPFGNSCYEYVFSFFTSLGYFERAEEDIKIFKNVQVSLVEAGILVLDFMNSNKLIEESFEPETYQINGVQFNIHKRVDGFFMVKQINIQDQGKSSAFTERVRLYGIRDFDRMLGEAGFKIIDHFGDYQLSAYHAQKSSRLIIIAKKHGAITST